MTPTPGPFGVYHRPGPRARWALVGTAPTAEAARAKMFELMGEVARGGDWTTAPTADPPADRPKVPDTPFSRR